MTALLALPRPGTRRLKSCTSREGRQLIMWNPGWTLATVIACAAAAGLMAAVVLAVLIERFG